MDESVGQQCVREWRDSMQGEGGLLILLEEAVDLASRIDALVRRERAQALREAGDDWPHAALTRYEAVMWLRARAAEEEGGE